MLDVKNSFPNGDLDGEAYRDFHLDLKINLYSNLCKFEKSLYRLKQSPRACFEKFTQSMKKQGYTQD